jgi:hypothetical protein
MCRLRFFEIYAKLGSIMLDFDILSILMGSRRVQLSLCIFYENLHDADVWSHLDSITSRPTGHGYNELTFTSILPFFTMKKNLMKMKS